MTAAAKLKAGFGAGFALLLGVGMAAVLQTLRWEESTRYVANTNEVIDRLEELSLLSKEAEDSARRFIATPDRRDLAQCGQELSQARERSLELARLIHGNAIRGNAVWQKDLVVISHLIDRQANTLLRGIGSAKTQSGDPADIRQALDSLDKTSLSEDLRAAIVGVESNERAILRSGVLWQERTNAMSRDLFVVASILSLALIVAAGWRLSADQKQQGVLELAMAAGEEHYRRVVEQAGDIIYRTDAEGRLVFCNQSALTLLHFNGSEVIGRSYLKVVRQDKRRAAERFYIRQYARKQRNTYYEFPMIDGHGHTRWIGQNVQLILEDGKGGRITGFQGIAREITERKEAEQELKKSRRFVERIAATTPGILYVYDLTEERTVYSNREVFSVLGYKPEDMHKMETVVQELIHPEDQAMIAAHHEALRNAADGDVRRVEYRARHAEGHWVWLSGRETAFERGSDGLVKQIVGIAQDITARKTAQGNSARPENYDALTGLSNRNHFRAGLKSAMRRASIAQSGTAVCLFDVDLFKDINERYGHAAGDEVLEAIGNIVRGELRSTDIAGRLGGDEFCVALPGTDRDECARVAERIRVRLATLAFGMASGSPFTVSATFGVAESAADGNSNELMEAADQALFRAKSAGRNRVLVHA